MNPAILIALPVILPLFGAAIALLTRHHTRLQLFITIFTLVINLVVSVSLMYLVNQYGVLVLQIGSWTPTLGIVLVADRLTGLMLLVSSVVTLAVLIYASAQSVSDQVERTPIAIFHPSYLLLVAGVSIAFVAGDLFNMYVGFEVLLAASFVLLTLGGSATRIRAATTYVIVSLVSSVFFLIGIAATYAAVGTVNLAEIALRMDQVDPSVRLIVEFVLLIAFAIKAAIFPLSAWLPDSYPTAPAPVTAVFAGLLTKVGIYAIIRLETLMFPESEISTVLLVAAGLSLVVGIFGAISQTDLKRVLSFTLVSHMGYMMFGIGISSQISMTATVYYVAHHITVQSTLFLAAGLIEHKGGTTNLAKLGGLAKISPWLAVIFFIPAMNLAGVPPFSGFIGKVGLIQGGIANGTYLAWILVFLSVAVSLLTLYAIAKVWNRAFWQEASEEIAQNPPHTPLLMSGSTFALVVFSIGLTVFAGPLIDYSAKASAALLERAPYISAVLGEDSLDRMVYKINQDGSGERG